MQLIINRYNQPYGSGDFRKRTSGLGYSFKGTFLQHLRGVGFDNSGLGDRTVGMKQERHNVVQLLDLFVHYLLNKIMQAVRIWVLLISFSKNG